eukprot:Hpha_TRINITY_DN16293_c1_g3::TRINITY_DN16293_c1_g3_i1::g.14365::m.14365
MADSESTAMKRAALLRAAAMLQQKLAEVSAPPLASLEDLGRSADVITTATSAHTAALPDTSVIGLKEPVRSTDVTAIPTVHTTTFADIPPPITAPDVVKEGEWVSAPTAAGPDSESGEEEGAATEATTAVTEAVEGLERTGELEAEAVERAEVTPREVVEQHWDFGPTAWRDAGVQAASQTDQSDCAVQTEASDRCLSAVQTEAPSHDCEAAEEALEQLRDKVRATQARATRAESETQRSEQQTASLRREVTALSRKCTELEAAVTAAEEERDMLRVESTRWEERALSAVAEALAATARVGDAEAEAMRRDKEVARRQDEFANVREEEMSLQGEVLRRAEEALRESEAAVAAAEERASASAAAATKAELETAAVRAAAERAAAEVEQLWQRHGLAAEREEQMRRGLQLAGELLGAAGAPTDGEWWTDSGALKAVEVSAQELPRRLARLHRERAQLASAAAASAVVEAAAVKEARDSEAALTALTSEGAKSRLSRSVFELENNHLIGSWQLFAQKVESDAALAVRLMTLAAACSSIPDELASEVEATFGDLLSTLFSAADRLVTAVGKSRHVAEVRSFQASLRALKLRWRSAVSPRSETLQHRLEQERMKVRRLQAELMALSPPPEGNDVQERHK